MELLDNTFLITWKILSGASTGSTSPSTMLLNDEPPGSKAVGATLCSFFGPLLRSSVAAMKSRKLFFQP
jgi:hypothetical protein